MKRTMGHYRCFASPDYKLVKDFQANQEQLIRKLNRDCGLHLEFSTNRIEPALLGKCRYPDNWMNYVEICVDGKDVETAYAEFCEDMCRLFGATVEGPYQGYVLKMSVPD